MKTYNVGILGATGAVGREMLKVLEERSFPMGELRLLASSRSVGKKIPYCGKEYEVQLACNIGIAGKIFTALGENDINIRMIEQGADEINIIIGVNDRNFKKTIRVLYNLSEVNE